MKYKKSCRTTPLKRRYGSRFPLRKTGPERVLQWQKKRISVF